jgi:hypothetical protein
MNLTHIDSIMFVNTTSEAKPADLQGSTLLQQFSSLQCPSLCLYPPIQSVQSLQTYPRMKRFPLIFTLFLAGKSQARNL